VPLAAGATLEDGLTSGEEAVLVCAGPEERVRAAGLKPIGTLTPDRAVRAVDAHGSDIALGSRGYDHFA
jgi:hypothetical protein